MVCYCFRAVCYWSWSRAFLIAITLSALGLVAFQYVEFNLSIKPLPLTGIIINSVFILIIILGVPCLIKFYVGLFIVYALVLIILIISSQASPNLIDFPVSRAQSQSDDALILSVKALLLVGLSWLLAGGQIIGSMLYLKDLNGYLYPLGLFAPERFNNSDSFTGGNASDNSFKLGWPSVAGLSTGSTYHEFGSTDSWNLPCSCQQSKSEASSTADASKPFKWPASPVKEDDHQLSITI